MNTFPQLFLFFLLGVSTLATVSAQEPQPTQTPTTQQSEATIQSAELLTNKDVMELLKAGLSPEVVIAKIKSSNATFDTSINGLQELKGAGVPDAVILAIVEKAAPKSSA